MIQQIYFNKTAEEVKIKEYDGYYSGNIAFKKKFLFENEELYPVESIIKESKIKYKIALLKSYLDKNLEINQAEINQICDGFHEKYFLIDKIKAMGVVFKYSTDMADTPEDFDYISEHSFVFLLEAYVGENKILKYPNNMIDISEQNESWDGDFMPLHYAVGMPYVKYRSYVMSYLYDLYDWIGEFYISNFNLSDFGAFNLANLKEVPSYENRMNYFKPIKDAIKNQTISSRAAYNIRFENIPKNEPENWWENMREKLKNELAQKYIHL